MTRVSAALCAVLLITNVCAGTADHENIITADATIRAGVNKPARTIPLHFAKEGSLLLVANIGVILFLCSIL